MLALARAKLARFSEAAVRVAPRPANIDHPRANPLSPVAGTCATVRNYCATRASLAPTAVNTALRSLLASR